MTVLPGAYYNYGRAHSGYGIGLDSRLPFFSGLAIEALSTRDPARQNVPFKYGQWIIQ